MNNFLKIFALIISYFSSIAVMIHCVLIFIAIDFLTGVYASYKTKKVIVSHRLRNTIEKFVFYTVSILIGYMFQINFIPSVNLTEIIAGFIAITEMLSIYENIKLITNINIVGYIKGYLKSIAASFLSKNKIVIEDEDKPSEPTKEQ